MSINKYKVYKEKKHMYAGSERQWENKSGIQGRRVLGKVQRPDDRKDNEAVFFKVPMRCWVTGPRSKKCNFPTGW